MKMKNILTLLIIVATLISCSTDKLKQTPDSQFKGTWVLSEKSMLDGIEIEITKDKDGNFKGSVTKLNDNKYVQMFMSVGDILVAGIKRKSNFEFEISEKKIAAPLFSQYGQSTTVKCNAQFESIDKITLGESGYYTRLN